MHEKIYVKVQAIFCGLIDTHETNCSSRSKTSMWEIEYSTVAAKAEIFNQLLDNDPMD